VVSGRGGDEARGPFGDGRGEDGVQRPARLEGAGDLLVLPGDPEIEGGIVREHHRTEMGGSPGAGGADLG
jgi:hypothetical protein